eukprot:5581317-Prymnesium_polylepis.1
MAHLPHTKENGFYEETEGFFIRGGPRLRRGPPLGVGGTPPGHAYHMFIDITWTRDAAQSRRWGAPFLRSPRLVA